MTTKPVTEETGNVTKVTGSVTEETGNVSEVTDATIAVSEEVPTKIESLPRKKRTTVRTLEQLADVPFAKMNTLEQKKYVAHLEETIRLAEQKAEAYSANGAQAFEQAAKMREIIDRLHTESIKKKDMLNTAIRAFVTTLELIMKEDN